MSDFVTLTPIYTIQGSGNTSPLNGTMVTTQGVVTARDTNGFYIQDVAGDGNTATSDGIFVFTSSAPPASAAVGSIVNVTATVQEFSPAGSVAGTLSITELSGTVTVTPVSTPNPLPTPVTLAPPTNDLSAGVAYYGSLEGMLVKVVAPQATGPTNQFGEIFTLVNNGAGATGVNGRGDILISGGTTSFGNTDTQGGDFNPERVQIDPGLGQATPDVSVGARLNDVTGIVSHSFGNYEVLATTPVTVATASPLVKTGTTLTGNTTHILIASYNAENLDPGDGAGRFTTVANEIRTKLNAPDILALQEIQDNNGPTDNGTTAANTTLSMIVDAINAQGGPTYAFIDNPFIGNDTNGGEPGGNIRTAYLSRTDHVSLVANSLRTIGADGSAVSAGPDTAQQTDPNNPFFGSRPPLAADFLFNGQVITIVNDHFTSKGGSGALLGTVQPPFDAGEVQRAAQAQAVNTFVDNLLTANPNARVIVTGDLNDYDFEQPLSVLKGTASISNYTANGADPFNATATYTPGGTQILNDLQDTLPADQRFDYVFEGNAQTLDHMLASNSLLAGAVFQPVHINSEFFDQTSDHDPLAGLFSITAPATDTAPPVLASSTPVDNAAGVAIGARIDGGAGTDVLSLMGSGSGTLANVINFETLSVQGGTWTVTDRQAYSAGVAVTGGDLQVTGSLGASPVTVGSGAILGGSGTVGNVTVLSGGTLSPGNSPGIINTGSLGLVAGATLKEEIAGAGAGQFDQVVVTGTVSLGGATLNLSELGGFNPVTATTFVIINNDGSDAVTGTFAGLSEGATVSLGASSYRISYIGGTGNDVVLTALNDVPVIVSNGGGDTAAVAIAENATAVTTVVANDPDPGTTLAYSLAGGADAALFQINAATGALAFVMAPNFEAPADADHNNSYLVQVRASDGSLSDTQAITVNVADVAEAGPPPATFTSARPVDFNADGTDDLLVRNGDGSVSVWTSSNGHVNPPAGPSGSAPLSTTIEGTGDFNGDGRGDILFRGADNHLVTWTMNGGQIQAITDIGSTSAAFHVAGTGDFNGDRTDDILFRGDNGQVVTWSMQGGRIASIQTAGTTDAASHIQGTGDFNGDGRTDILFRNEAGQVTTWLMQNGQVSGIVPVGSAPATAHIAATGDFNGDGATDILFRADDGHVTEWLINGGRISSIVENVGSADSSWRIQGAGDVNGNGTDDILWRNDDGHVVDWMMNGGHLTTIQDLGHTPVPTYIGGSQFDLL